MIDCTGLGYPDGTAAVNYLTSHDVEGFRKERLLRFFLNNGFHRRNAEGVESPDTERIARRVKLGFVCLLTSVGVPMILAGEEFADDHDRVVEHPAKQSDPVNYTRLEDPWRKSLAQYVARLVSFRTRSDALSVNDTRFIHADFTNGRRILAWMRGRPGIDDPVVVVANFSDYESAREGHMEYQIANWPVVAAGKHWREISQDRAVPDDWAGREPLYPWEAKVYAVV
jgi:pullulanase